MMTFVELPAFSRARQNYLSDAEFAELQTYLLDAPDAGDVIPGSGGCRKLRGFCWRRKAWGLPRHLFFAPE